MKLAQYPAGSKWQSRDFNPYHQLTTGLYSPVGLNPLREKSAIEGGIDFWKQPNGKYLEFVIKVCSLQHSLYLIYTLKS